MRYDGGMTDAIDQGDAEPSNTEAVDAGGSNLAPVTVSELAFALKRTLEDSYGFVRVRGEISKVTFHSSGHVYLDLKDERACISGVVWRGQVRGLAVRPETGLEVVVTGKITTYPGRSQYQIVIETMAPAGVGALLAQLERLKARLAAEGLFEAGRKRPLPPFPGVIGVITSPTGAVIRDILHRLTERWPCRVIVWPVVVQGGQTAAPGARRHRGLRRTAARRWRSPGPISSSSRAAADRWKTSGRSTMKTLPGRRRPRPFRSFRLSDTRPTPP